MPAVRAFFARALTHGPAPVAITTDRALVYPQMLNDLVPAGRHVVDQYANNRVESDHARLEARLRPMRGMKTIKSVRTIATGHAFVQNLRRGHYELTADVSAMIESGSRPAISRGAFDATLAPHAVIRLRSTRSTQQTLCGCSAAASDAFCV